MSFHSICSTYARTGVGLSSIKSEIKTACHLICNINLDYNYGYRKVQKIVVSGSGKVEKHRAGVAAVKNYLTVTHFIIHADVGLAKENCQVCKAAPKSWGKHEVAYIYLMNNCTSVEKQKVKFFRKKIINVFAALLLENVYSYSRAIPRDPSC